MNQRLVNRFASVLKHNHTTSTSSLLLRYRVNGVATSASYHVNIKNSHVLITEEKRMFLEALKVELFNSNRSLNVANSQRSYSTVASTELVDGFDKSLENSRNLMTHKRHDVLTQQESEYFLYL